MCDNISALPTAQHHNRGSLRCENVEISFKLSEIHTQEIQFKLWFSGLEKITSFSLRHLWTFIYQGFLLLSAFFAQRQPQSKRQRAASDGDVTLEKRDTSECLLLAFCLCHREWGRTGFCSWSSRSLAFHMLRQYCFVIFWNFFLFLL